MKNHGNVLLMLEKNSAKTEVFQKELFKDLIKQLDVQTELLITPNPALSGKQEDIVKLERLVIDLDSPYEECLKVIHQILTLYPEFSDITVLERTASGNMRIYFELLPINLEKIKPEKREKLISLAKQVVENFLTYFGFYGLKADVSFKNVNHFIYVTGRWIPRKKGKSEITKLAKKRIELISLYKLSKALIDVNSLISESVYKYLKRKIVFDINQLENKLKGVFYEEVEETDEHTPSALEVQDELGLVTLDRLFSYIDKRRKSKNRRFTTLMVPFVTVALELGFSREAIELFLEEKLPDKIDDIPKALDFADPAKYDYDKIKEGLKKMGIAPKRYVKRKKEFDKNVYKAIKKKLDYKKLMLEDLEYRYKRSKGELEGFIKEVETAFGISFGILTVIYALGERGKTQIKLQRKKVTQFIIDEVKKALKPLGVKIPDMRIRKALYLLEELEILQVKKLKSGKAYVIPNISYYDLLTLFAVKFLKDNRRVPAVFNRWRAYSKSKDNGILNLRSKFRYLVPSYVFKYFNHYIDMIFKKSFEEFKKQLEEDGIQPEDIETIHNRCLNHDNPYVKSFYDIFETASDFNLWLDLKVKPIDNPVKFYRSNDFYRVMLRDVSDDELLYKLGKEILPGEKLLSDLVEYWIGDSADG